MDNARMKYVLDGDSAQEKSADERVYLESLRQIGHIGMNEQISNVGESAVYDGRPRYWVIDGRTYYASFADFIEAL